MSRRKAADLAADAAPALPVDRDVLAAFARHPKFAAALARVQADPQGVDAMLARIERDTLAEQSTIRDQRRWDAYAATRRFDYATACYADLRPQQDPDGKTTGWWGTDHRSLLLAGPSGRGKTHSAYSIANTVAAADRDGTVRASVRAWSAVELADRLRPLAVHERHDENMTRRQDRDYDDARGCDLLLLDDLGRENVTEWWRERLFSILDARASDRRRRTIITLNAEAPDVKDRGPRVVEALARYGEPVVTRVRQGAVFAWIDGEQMRRTATWDPFG